MALIYIVEDDKNIQEIEMFALKNIDYAVEGFECAGDFYKRLYEKLPDLVLLDVMLPDEDGLEIVKKLKKVIEYAEEQNVMNKTKDVFARIIELRNICNVKNLTYINNLVTSQVAFRKSQTLETNVYVLYVWLRICDIIAEKNTINVEYDEQKLINKI